MRKAINIVAAPMVVCVKPTVFERIFFGFMAFSLLHDEEYSCDEI